MKWTMNAALLLAIAAPATVKCRPSTCGLSRRGPLAKQGLPLEEVMKRTDFSRYRDQFGTTERDKTLFKAYWTDPMTENAWKEAKGLPIVQGEGEVNVRKQSEKKN